jgi:hypothetical protein
LAPPGVTGKGRAERGRRDRVDKLDWARLHQPYAMDQRTPSDVRSGTDKQQRADAPVQRMASSSWVDDIEIIEAQVLDHTAYRLGRFTWRCSCSRVTGTIAGRKHDEGGSKGQAA